MCVDPFRREELKDSVRTSIILTRDLYDYYTCYIHPSKRVKEVKKLSM